jgi:rare lipoprotein A
VNTFIAKNYRDRHSAGEFRQKCLKRRTSASVSILLIALFIAGCGSTPKRTEPSTKPSTTIAKPGGYYLDDGPGDNLPANLEQIPDAIPRNETLHRGANRPYTIFGKTYVPNVSSDSFRQSGVASWYGKKFHGQKTSIGEIYDMYAMTAAHPTLPLPSYVRVTNPANAKSIVVRVNDRGPFHADRIIDLSYLAAAKLDIARRGSAMVNVERVFAGEATPPPVMASTAPVVAPTIAPTTITTPTISADADVFYLQLGAFSSLENAGIFRERMMRELDWNREPIAVRNIDGLFRVRLGPYKTRDEAEAAVTQIKQSHDFSPLITKP